MDQLPADGGLDPALGDILNTRTELAQGARSVLPPLKGHIEFDQVHFRYRPDGSEVLRGISLSIQPGEVIGVVGRSGSGKSTLTRLIQRLYSAERGRVMIDGWTWRLPTFRPCAGRSA